MIAVTTRTSVSDELSASTFSGLSVNFAASGAPKMWAFWALSSGLSEGDGYFQSDNLKSHQRIYFAA